MGRDAELALLMGVVEGAETGRGAVVLLSGDPGIGKSRLADEVAERARGRGFAIARGRGWEAGGAPPFWAWTRALRSVLQRQPTPALDVLSPDVLQRLHGILPELGGDDPIGSTAADRFALFDAVATLIRTIAHERPLLLLLDDLHAMDQPSLLLLRFVAAELRDAPVVAIGTHRSGEAWTDDAVRQLLADLARENQHIPVGALDADALLALTRAHLGATDDGYVDELVESTGGNPFYAVELLRLRAAGESRRVPDTIRGTLLRRLERVAPETRSVLDVAAVAGHRLDPNVLSRVLDLPAQEVTAVLDRCVDQGFMTPAEDGRYRFSHGLVRESIYDLLPAAERGRLHAAVLGALESLRGGQAERHLAELAHHALVAGEELAGRAIAYAEAAGARAADQLAFEEAARHYRRAVDAADLANVGVDRLMQLLLGQGDALNASGHVDPAREAFLRVVDLARRHGSSDALARAALGYSGLHWDTFATNERAVALLREALEVLPAVDDPLRARCLARLGYELAWGTGDTARQRAEEGLAMARRLGDASLVARCMAACRHARGPLRPLPELIREIDETIAAAREAGELHDELFAEVARIALLLRAGDRVGMEREIVAHAHRAETHRLPYHRWWAMVHRALLALVDGHLEDAARLSGEAAGFGARINPAMAMSVFGPQYWTVLLERNDIEVAFQAFTAMPEEVLRPPVMQLGLRTMEVWRGNIEAGRRLLDEWCRDRFAGIPADPTRPGVLNHLATMAVTTEHREAAAALVELLLPMEDEAVTAASFTVFTTYAHHLARLLTLLERWDEAERALDSADRVAARLEAPVHAGWAQHARARYLLARGEREAARTILEELVEDATAAGHLRLAANAAADLDQLAPPPPSSARPSLVRDGEDWTLVAATGTTRLRASKGLTYLATLLANPGVDIHVMELVSEVGPTGFVARPRDEGLVASRPGDLGPVLDAQAKAAYRRRLDDLREELDEAERFNDPERKARATVEMDALLAELSSATGLGGRDRRMGSRVEQTRVNVTKAIRTAIKRVTALDAVAGAHLATTVRTGTFCSYHPALDPAATRLSPGPDEDLPR